MTVVTESYDFIKVAGDLPPDVAPASSFDHSCQTCGKELIYAGRGRYPKFCDEHKPASKARGTSKTGSGTNAVLARQAAELLAQLNSLIALGLVVPAIPLVGPNPLFLPETAGALAEADEGFTDAAYNALLTDPKLCKLILRTGGASGKIALLIAYAMLAAAVVPVGVNEFRESHGSDRSEN